MKTILMLLALIFSSMSASGQYINVINSPSGCIVDGSGASIASGTLTVVGTNELNKAIPYRAGTSNQVTTKPVTRTVTTGSLATSLQLADPAQSSPLNILYHITILDRATARVSDYPLVAITPNDTVVSGSYTEFNICKMNPSPLTPQLLYSSGPIVYNGNQEVIGNFSVIGTLSATAGVSCTSCVTTNTTQSVTGAKTLSGGLTLNTNQLSLVGVQETVQSVATAPYDYTTQRYDKFTMGHAGGFGPSHSCYFGYSSGITLSCLDSGGTEDLIYTASGTGGSGGTFDINGALSSTSVSTGTVVSSGSVETPQVNGHDNLSGAGAELLLRGGNSSGATAGANTLISAGESGTGTGGSVILQGGFGPTASGEVIVIGPLKLSPVIQYNGTATEGSGLPPIYKAVSLFGVTASISSTNLYASIPNGMYRVCYYAATTLSGTGTTATVSIGWTDGFAKTYTSGTFALNSTTITGQVNDCQVIRTSGAAAITYAVTAASIGTSRFSFDATVERLQ